MKKVSCVIMDWAGTAVDFGCFAPLNAFLKVFQEQGVTITYRQAREPMGLLKIEHIKAILKMPEVSERFRTAHGREWNQNDVAIMYQSFEKHLFASLQDFTTPVPGVIETMEQLRREGIRIGSTTPDHLPAGRPAPYMIYRNMTELAIPSVDEVVKVGDTIADIREGLNAKVCSVGVITGSNELGLTEEEYKTMPEPELYTLKQEVRERMMAAGAHYVLDNIRELPDLIHNLMNKK